MEFLTGLPAWALAALIFSIRVVDVSIGTLRMISVVQGRLTLSVVLGFLEVSVWITALSQVMMRVSENPALVLAYAGGFALGNAVGIALERGLALGAVVVRIISPGAGEEIAARLRDRGLRVTTFCGQGRDGPVMMIYSLCRRRQLPEILAIARGADEKMFYSVEQVQQWRETLPQPLACATGWRASSKRR